jgi:hypothetical protein
VELVLLLNVPSAHAAHFRSLLAVAATVVWKPGAHAALTGGQGAPLFTSENVEPALQAAHLRSVVVEPAVDSPWPTGHVAHAMHAWLPALLLKVPFWHGEHLRSDARVFGVVSYSPALHVVSSVHWRSLCVVASVLS